MPPLCKACLNPSLLTLETVLYFLAFGCNLKSTGTGKALGSSECKLLDDGHAFLLTLYLPYLPFDLNMGFFACDGVSFHT